MPFYDRKSSAFIRYCGFTILIERYQTAQHISVKKKNNCSFKYQYNFFYTNGLKPIEATYIRFFQTVINNKTQCHLCCIFSHRLTYIQIYNKYRIAVSISYFLIGTVSRRLSKRIFLLKYNPSDILLRKLMDHILQQCDKELYLPVFAYLFCIVLVGNSDGLLSK